jgi:hypothetical protein
MGTIHDMQPTPIPLYNVSIHMMRVEGSSTTHVMKRPARISLCPPAIAVIWTTTPMMNTPVAAKIPYFRESDSATKPDMRAPNQAPSSRIAVSQPFCVGLSMYPSVSKSLVSINEESYCENRCRTFTKRWHSQDTREHALIISIKDTSQAGEQGNPEDLEVLDQSSRTTLAHQGLTPLKRGIKAGRCCSTTAHYERSIRVVMVDKDVVEVEFW